MSVRADTDGPFRLIVLPEGDVIEQQIGKVVLDKIFSRRAHVDRVPIGELVAQLVEFLLRRRHRLFVVFSIREDVVPRFGRHFFRSKSSAR